MEVISKKMAAQEKLEIGDEHLGRIRRICAALPGATERLSHGEPTFLVHRRVFAMFANNHHDDGHIAVWLPAPPGFQAMLVKSLPKIFFKPPYVGVRGWIGIELDRISDEDLAYHIREAWQLVAPKSLQRKIAKLAPGSR